MRRLVLSIATLLLATTTAFGTAFAQAPTSSRDDGGYTASKTGGPYAVAQSRGWVADALGTHHVKPGDAIYLPCAAAKSSKSEVCHIFGSAQAANVAFKSQSARSGATAPLAVSPDTVGPCPGTAYNTQFTTHVSSSWSTLVARSAPCQSGTTITGSYSTGQAMNVTKEDDNGQFICRGSSYGYGTSVWYYTSKGWSWAGGTETPQWNYWSIC